jgi:hypothetical protein
MSKLTAFEWGLYIGNAVEHQGGFMFILHGIDIFLDHIELLSYNVLMNKQKYEESDCKPILRSLDQMTDEERAYITSKYFYGYEFYVQYVFLDEMNNLAVRLSDDSKYYMCHVDFIDWLTEKGFAIRNEFERGVAVEDESK